MRTMKKAGMMMRSVWGIRKPGKLLQSRRGESLAEVMAASVTVMVLLGTLYAGIRFASGELVKAQEMQDMSEQYQESLRRNLADGFTTCVDGQLSFDGGTFTIPVQFQTVEASARSHETGEEQTTIFHLLTEQDLPDGKDEPHD